MPVPPKQYPTSPIRDASTTSSPATCSTAARMRCANRVRLLASGAVNAPRSDHGASAAGSSAPKPKTSATKPT